MNSERVASPDVLPQSNQSGRHSTPPPAGLRHRPLSRAATFADLSSRYNARKGSFLSDVPSESRRSIRTSTDDILLPRATTTDDEEALESSHWHSIPLGLALLPAVGGLFFQNGSGFITDVTLLALAALFLNWSVRLPWDWYHAAQEVLVPADSPSAMTPIEEQEDDETVDVESKEQQTIEHPPPLAQAQAAANAEAARQELRTHELLALAACFIFPALGAWLLHEIRGQLSRPSEGLVSNYNLTIFLLASEVRPLSHLIKLVQRRTLFLQRTVSASVLREQADSSSQKLTDLAKRIDDLETHTADAITSAAQSPATATQTPEDIVAKAAAFANTEMRKQVQPELDALNRAMRRYEKRMTVSAIQVEARIQDLETKLQDVVVLAAAAQRSIDKQHNYFGTLMNWISALVVVPIQQFLQLLALPGKLLENMLNFVKKKTGLGGTAKQKDVRGATRTAVVKQRSKDKKPKPS